MRNKIYKRSCSLEVKPLRNQRRVSFRDQTEDHKTLEDVFMISPGRINNFEISRGKKCMKCELF